MFATYKARDRMFGNPLVNECNEILRSCRTKEERIKAAPLIRSKIKLDTISDKLLSRGLVGNII